MSVLRHHFLAIDDRGPLGASNTRHSTVPCELHALIATAVEKLRSHHDSRRKGSRSRPTGINSASPFLIGFHTSATATRSPPCQSTGKNPISPPTTTEPTPTAARPKIRARFSHLRQNSLRLASLPRAFGAWISHLASLGLGFQILQVRMPCPAGDS